MAGVEDLFSEKFIDEISDVGKEIVRIDDLAKGMSKTITDAFHGAILDGKSLRSLLADIGRSFADITLQAALKPVGILVSDVVNNLFTATNSALNPPPPFAQNGAIAAPDNFPIRDGLDLAGTVGTTVSSSGPNSRGRSGLAGSGSAAISISMQVKADDAQSFLRSEAEVGAMLLRAVKRGQRAS